MHEPTPLLYQSVGFQPNSEPPTEQHINEALLEAFRTPACQFAHNRVWLPHREGAGTVSRVWQYINTHTNAALCREPSTGAITNCGHMVFFMLANEDAEHVRQSHRKEYITYTPEHFRDGLFRGETSLTNHYDTTWWMRAYGTFHYPAAQQYGRALQERGYDVGFLGCVISSPNSFNDTFGEYFPDGPVHPVVMVFAGTRASAVRHLTLRDRLTVEMMSGKSYFNVPWPDLLPDAEAPDPSERRRGAVQNTLYRWNDSHTRLDKIPAAEVEALHYIKNTDEYTEMVEKFGNPIP